LLLYHEVADENVGAIVVFSAGSQAGFSGFLASFQLWVHGSFRAAALAMGMQYGALLYAPLLNPPGRWRK
jgi:hypothetical protein